MRLGAVAGLATAVVVAGPAVAAERSGSTAVEIEVPAIGDLPATKMSAELFLPAGAGPFPVVVYSHGRASKAEDRARLKQPIPRGHAGYWMGKGFAVVAPIRPGYGVAGAVDRERSGTQVREDGSCGGEQRLAAASNASRRRARRRAARCGRRSTGRGGSRGR